MNNILLIEDSLADIVLLKQCFKTLTTQFNIHVVSDGEEAINFLNRQGIYSESPKPDLILLDLNLPKKSGLEVLKEIKADKSNKVIPVIVLTTSESENDIKSVYYENANCYIIKPLDFSEFKEIVKVIENFWFKNVVLTKEKN